jgi:signal transduction histidine kinase
MSRTVESALIPPAERTRRNLLLDLLVVLIGLAGVGLAVFAEWIARPPTPTGLLVTDLVVGVVGALALWWRRRFPVTLATTLMVVDIAVSSLSLPAGLSLFTVALYRPMRTSVSLGGLTIAAALVAGLIRPDAARSYWTTELIVAAGTTTVVAWGTALRARRQLVASLAERVRRAEAEQSLREAHAREAERTRIAREMHDVLAHRLSLLSVHAGALEFRPDARPEDIARAAGVVRAGARQALQDLREVIGVLRENDEQPAPGATAPAGAERDDPPRPQPTLAELPDLLDESRTAGTPVELDAASTLSAEAPAQVGRHVYRIVQEGLTNARKHAPRCPVRVLVQMSTLDGVVVDLRNPLPRANPAAEMTLPGAGTGLIGIAERVVLAGGRMEHGTTEDCREFRLHVWLPWPT